MAKSTKTTETEVVDADMSATETTQEEQAVTDATTSSMADKDTQGNDVNEPEATRAYRARIAQGVFEAFPQQNVLYFTSDMLPFFEESEAAVQASMLRNKTIIVKNRE